MHFVAKGSLTLKFEPWPGWSLVLDACMQNTSSQSWSSRSLWSTQRFLSHLHTFRGKVKFSEVFLVPLWWQEAQGVASDRLCLESPDLLVGCFCCYSKPAWRMALGAVGSCSLLRCLLGNKKPVYPVVCSPPKVKFLSITKYLTSFTHFNLLLPPLPKKSSLAYTVYCLFCIVSQFRPIRCLST